MNPVNFEMQVDYMKGGQSVFLPNRDLDYIRKRINTHRAVNTFDIGVDSSRYYEGAKTLVDLLGIFMEFISADLRNVTMSIHVIQDTQNTDLKFHSTLIASLDYHPAFVKKSIPMRAAFSYLADPPSPGTDEDSMGAFYINFMLDTSDAGYVDADFGYSRYPDGAEADGPQIFTKANANGVINYSENFPTPSVMAYDMMNTVANLEHEYSKQLNENMESEVTTNG